MHSIPRAENEHNHGDSLADRRPEREEIYNQEREEISGLPPEKRQYRPLSLDHLRPDLTEDKRETRLHGLKERFRSKTDRREPDECWEWQGKIGTHDYGELSYRNHRTLLAHRLSYLLNIGPIPEDPKDIIMVCHSCHSKPCVNPAHLHLGTNSENLLETLRDDREACRKKLSPGEREEIRVRVAGGETRSSLAQEFRISKTRISQIVNRNRRR